MASPLSSFMESLRIEKNATDFAEVICDNARIENPIGSLHDSISSLESIKFTTSPVLEADDERKAIKKKARWVDDFAYIPSVPAGSSSFKHLRPAAGRISRSNSDEVSLLRCRQRPPACPRRQVSNESLSSLEDYQKALLSLKQANHRMRVADCSAVVGQRSLPAIPSRRPARMPLAASC